MKYVLIGLLKLYRLLISPLYGNVCRYYPSCSAYALRAVQVHGALRGSWYASRRVVRCHPWSAGGYDPVPGTPEFAEEMRAREQTTTTIERVSDGGTPQVLAGRETLDQRPDRRRKQGTAAMVAQVRGVK